MTRVTLEQAVERIDSHIRECQEQRERHARQHAAEQDRAEESRREVKESIAKLHARIDEMLAARTGRLMTWIVVLFSAVVGLLTLAAALFGQLQAVTG